MYVCVGVKVLPERRGCLHTVSRGLQNVVCSGSTFHTPEALLSDNTKAHLSEERALSISCQFLVNFSCNVRYYNHHIHICFCFFNWNCPSFEMLLFSPPALFDQKSTSRQTLVSLSISLNSFDNGIFLPTKSLIITFAPVCTFIFHDELLLRHSFVTVAGHTLVFENHSQWITAPFINLLGRFVI